MIITCVCFQAVTLYSIWEKIKVSWIRGTWTFSCKLIRGGVKFLTQYQTGRLTPRIFEIGPNLEWFKSERLIDFLSTCSICRNAHLNVFKVSVWWKNVFAIFASNEIFCESTSKNLFRYIKLFFVQSRVTQFVACCTFWFHMAWMQSQVTWNWDMIMVSAKLKFLFWRKGYELN